MSTDRSLHNNIIDHRNKKNNFLNVKWANILYPNLFGCWDIGALTVKIDAKLAKKRIIVLVQRSNTVKELKELIREQTGIQPERQILKVTALRTVFVLKDTDTMENYCIRKGTVISLATAFQITVESDENVFKKMLLFGTTNTTTVEVNGIDKVEKVKEMIMEKLNGKFVTDHKRLTLWLNDRKYTNPILNDQQTMNDFGIKEGRVVRLSIGEFEIVVKRYETENVQEEYTVWVKGGETVEILKKKIENESDIWCRRQILKWNNANGPEMFDKKTLEDYDIGNGTKKNNKNDRIPVQRKLLSKSNIITVLVNRTEKVEDVKKKIENESGIEPRAQTLKFNENGPEMEDARTLESYGIVNYGTSIFFESKEFEVSVNYVPEGKWQWFTVHKEDTLATLKDKISKKYTEKYKKQIPNIKVPKEVKNPYQIRNLDDVKQMWKKNNEGKTLEECGIEKYPSVAVFYVQVL
ncbi:hypothetical protein niasHT_005517 [Heterodera trifolii]|uniref:Ubiquitin-like domain-containing protein n=1 Tax=Heterodera trifolii TaxID=157864 RepID=A0ABD2LVN3_9BILA